MAQPIPKEEIQKHYAGQLEVELAKHKAVEMINAVYMPAQVAFSQMCESYNIKAEEYDFDLKNGTMTKKAKPDA